ncbi:MAG: type II CAAX endopeptidase family protein [Myxococcota bacterium]
MKLRRGLLAIAFGLAAVVAVGASWQLARRFAANPAEQLVLAGIGFEVFLALVAFAGATLSSAPLGERLGLGPSRLPGAQLVALVVGTLGLSLALDGLLDLTHLREQSAVLLELETRLYGVRGRTLALALVGLALVPGGAEELLCRGLLQRGLQRRLGAPLAIAVAALAFGALHVDPVHAASATLLGLYLGAAAYLAGSTRASIACHVVNNLVAVTTTAWGLGAMPYPVVTAAAGGAVAAGCLWWVRRRTAPLPAPRPAPVP